MSSKSSVFWDGREKLRAQKLGATATRHTASIHSVLTYFGFATAWLLMGVKRGAASMLGTIWQLLLRTLWLLREGKSQDDSCPHHHPKKHSRVNAGSRSHGAVTTPSPICSGNGTAASHTHSWQGGTLLGTGLGEGMYQSSLGFSRTKLPKGSSFKPST